MVSRTEEKKACIFKLTTISLVCFIPIPTVVDAVALLG